MADKAHFSRLIPHAEHQAFCISGMWDEFQTASQELGGGA
jgi:hypothetical protein